MNNEGMIPDLMNLLAVLEENAKHGKDIGIFIKQIKEVLETCDVAVDPMYYKEIKGYLKETDEYARILVNRFVKCDQEEAVEWFYNETASGLLGLVNSIRNANEKFEYYFGEGGEKDDEEF